MPDNSHITSFAAIFRGDRMPGAVAAKALVAAVIALTAPTAVLAQTAVRDVDLPARQPFGAALRNQVFNSPAATFVLADVPPGKRLVVEHVSVNIVVAPTPRKQSHVNAFLHTQLNGQRITHKLVLDKERELPANLADSFAASQPIRTYADPGTPVSVVVTLTPDGVRTHRANLNLFSLTGHLVDIGP